ncbi:MAG: ABC transporter substrate-binding protein [Clostridiales Family XIII bacterium]|jgi:ribose transport system substrate-binding protein|nr:ABC transporter substrate-binding protein [Clostridiales Family XIII bacterium]
MLGKNRLAMFLTALFLCFTLAACGGGGGGQENPPADSGDNGQPTSSDSGEVPYIAIVSKGFQHQFWQVVKKGAEQAAADFGVEITFDGPPTESDIAIQVDMLKSALDKNPAAIALAALDTESVTEQLTACMNSGIPVIGFDSGVPNAPAGSIYATASTNNSAAAAVAAEQLYRNSDFSSKLASASASAPIYVGVLSQDATSDSIISRTSGFIDKLAELIGVGDVQVTGHDKFAKEAANGAKVIITVSVPATTAAADMKSAAEAMLTSGRYTAIYGSNENGAGGILAASNDGSDFADGAKYGDIIAIGFDAGKTQRTAVENGWFYGSVTQDPYSIGYKAVSLAVDAINNKPISDPIVDTGAKWYNSENLSDPSISELVYE